VAKKNLCQGNTVFSFIFSNPDTLRELYGAVSGIELPPDIPVTVNPNLPVRVLMYIARVYENEKFNQTLLGMNYYD
jgi:hypothetical protein